MTIPVGVLGSLAAKTSRIATADSDSLDTKPTAVLPSIMSVMSRSA